jgi:hypothetical protein
MLMPCVVIFAYGFSAYNRMLVDREKGRRDGRRHRAHRGPGVHTKGQQEGRRPFTHRRCQNCSFAVLHLAAKDRCKPHASVDLRVNMLSLIIAPLCSWSIRSWCTTTQPWTGFSAKKRSTSQASAKRFVPAVPMCSSFRSRSCVTL